MAFRLLDFGIPDYDSNVEVLYQRAVEKGESHFIGDKEFIVYEAGTTNMLLILCFEFDVDGETPKNVIAHTFLKNEVRWQGTIETTNTQSFFYDGQNKWPVEVIHPIEAQQKIWTPMLYIDKMDFSKNESVFASVESGIRAIDNDVKVIAKIGKITPIALSQLWIYSLVELWIGEKRLYAPVPREHIEDHIMDWQEGVWCEISGKLSLMKVW